MEDRLERALNEKKLLALQVEIESESTPNTRLQEQTLKELQQLTAQVQQLKKQKKEEILELQRQRDEAMKRVGSLEDQLKRIKDTLTDAKQFLLRKLKLPVLAGSKGKPITDVSYLLTHDIF